MITTIILTVVVFAGITASVLFFPTLKIGKVKIGTYWLVALVGALFFIGFSLAPIGEVWDKLTQKTEINPLKILVLFFSMTFLSVYLDEVGLFKYLAVKAANSAKRGQISLFIATYFLAALLTVFTSNDIVILTLTPFICFFCKNTDIDPVPYLLGEFAAANTWSMMLVIGNPTNIYLATTAQIGFVEYVKVMALPTVVAGIAELGLIVLLFRKKLQKPLVKEEQKYTCKSKADVLVGVVFLVVCLIFLVISDTIGWEMWLIAAISAGGLLVAVLVLRFIKRGTWGYLGNASKRLPWQLIPFVLSMFVIVVGLETQGISEKITEFLGDKQPIWSYGAASYLCSNLINNIPMSMLFSSVANGAQSGIYREAVYASIAGSNLGAFFTPIGALAGIMFTSLTQRYEVKYGFREFIKYGSIIGLPTLAATLAVLSATVQWG